MAPGGRTCGLLVDVNIIRYCRIGELGGHRRGGTWDLRLLDNISSRQRVVGHYIAVICIVVWVPVTQSTEKKVMNCSAPLPNQALQLTVNPLRGLCQLNLVVRRLEERSHCPT